MKPEKIFKEPAKAYEDSEDLIEIKVERMRKDIRDIQDKVNAIVLYFSELMKVELVRNVKDGKLRFANKEVL